MVKLPKTTFLSLLFVGFICFLLFLDVSCATATPTWLSCPFIQSNTTVHRTDMSTFSSTSAPYTVATTFAHAFSQTPRIGYGIRTMRSNFFIPFSSS